MALARQLHRQGELLQATVATENALRLARANAEQPYAHAELDTLALLARLQHARGRAEEFESYLCELRHCLDRAKEVEPVERVRHISRLASVLQEAQRHDDAIDLLADAANIYTGLKDLKGLAQVARNAASIMIRRGDSDSAIPLFGQREAILRLLGNLEELQVSLGHHAELLTSHCRLDEANGLAEERERICRQIDGDDEQRKAHAQNAHIQGMRDDLDERVKLALQEERSSEERRDYPTLVDSMLMRGFWKYMRGHCSEAISTVERAQSIAEAHGLTEHAKRARKAADGFRSR